MKILLDTSFLLPTIGINVTHPLIPQVLQKLASQPSAWQISYTELNLLELAWIYLKTKKSTDGQANTQKFYQLGLESISKRYSKLDIPVEVYLRATKLKETGHSDLIDCLLYEIAEINRIQLITLDIPLIKFINETGRSMTSIISGQDFLNQNSE